MEQATFWVNTLACIFTFIGLIISYLAYKYAKAANIKVDNSLKVTKNSGIVQSHAGKGDNVGGSKNG